MKKIIPLFLVMIIIAGCGGTSFKICDAGREQDQIESKLMPIKTGNKWFYNMSARNPQTGEMATQKITIEIGDLVEIFYMEGDKKVSVFGYQMIMNGQKMPQYYIKCEGELLSASCSQEDMSMIESTRTYPESFKKGWIDPRNDNFFYKGEESEMIIGAGLFDAWIVDEKVNDPRYPDEVKKQMNIKKIPQTRRYYAQGVGLIKLENMMPNGQPAMTMELVNYEFK